MALFQSILIPSSPSSATLFTASLAATTSTADIAVGKRTIIGVTAAGASGANPTSGLNIRFMNSTSSSQHVNASASDWFIPGGSTQFFDTGEEFDTIRLFNPAAGAVTYYVYCFTQK